jgi:tetratricopeptide (TPR) repeat protein
MIKKLFISFFIFHFSIIAFAEEGMWIPAFLKKLNESDMQTMGMKLCAEDIYSLNKSSLKDAIVSLNGGGCTAEVISDKGLILTNHHCGFSEIQALSSIEKDYLKNGFWAMSNLEELPAPGMKASFIIMMEDVTSQVMKDVSGPMTDEALTKIKKNAQEIISKVTEGTHYEATIKPFNYGNSYFLIVQETFTDVRLVFAPPSSIGKFGGDTDNWMWPRHTGDFSMFRIYAGKDNKPAKYSENNVPYKPAHSLPINTDGVKKDDFTMVFGFPGTTKQYLTSFAVENIMNHTNPARIKMREKSLEIIDAAMLSSDTIRIKYAAKQARISNAYKKWIGESKGLKRLNAIEKKKALEAEFTMNVYQKQENIQKYGQTLEKLKELNQQSKDLALAADYFNELVSYGPEFLRYTRNFEYLIDEYTEISKDKEKLNAELEKLKRGIRFFRNYNAKTDRKIFESLFKMYKEGTPKDLLPDYFLILDKKYKGNYDLLTKDIYEKSIFTDSAKVSAILKNFSSSAVTKIKADPAFMLMKGLYEGYDIKVSPDFQFLNFEIEMEMKTYVAGLMELIPDTYWFDANSTLRVAYGKVEGSQPKDGIEYNYFTTLDGLMDKYIPGDSEFDVPEKLRQLYYSKNYGTYAEDGKIHVAFTASNQTTGGNSGSPVLNAYGELIGINFDRTWESTMSDVMYDPEQCRNIAMDIRYMLFIVDKFAGATYLLDEMNLMNSEKRNELEKQKLQGEFVMITDSIKVDPGNTQLLIRRGNKYLSQKMPESAINDFLAAYKIDSNNENLILLIGNTYLLLDKPKEVVPYVEKLMNLKVTPNEAFLLRGKLRVRNERYSDAITDLNRYINSKGVDYEAYLIRAKALVLTNKKVAACEDIYQYEAKTGLSQEILRKEVCGK